MASPERERLLAMLAERPLIAQVRVPWMRVRVQALLGGALAFVLLMLRGYVPVLARSGTLQNSLLLGAALAIIVGVLTAVFIGAWRERAVLATPYRCGQFIYRFGFVDAQPGRVTILSGNAITAIETDVGRPSDTGVSWVTVAVTGARTRRQVRFRGLDADIPQTALAEVRHSSWGKADGYRTAGPPFDAPELRRLREVGPHLAPATIALVALAVFTITESWILPANALARASRSATPMDDLSELAYAPWPPWLREEARRELDARWPPTQARLNVELREPWRAEALDLLRRARAGERVTVRRDHGTCEWSQEAELVIDEWVAAQGLPIGADGRAGPVWSFAELRSGFPTAQWLLRFERSTAGIVREWTGSTDRDAGVGEFTAVLVTECRITPTRLERREHRGYYAALEAEVTLTLRVAGREPVHTTTLFRPEPRASELPRSDAPYGRWQNQLLRHVDDHMEAVMFAVQDIPCAEHPAGDAQ